MRAVKTIGSVLAALTVIGVTGCTADESAPEQDSQAETTDGLDPADAAIHREVTPRVPTERSRSMCSRWR